MQFSKNKFHIFFYFNVKNKLHLKKKEAKSCKRKFDNFQSLSVSVPLGIIIFWELWIHLIIRLYKYCYKLWDRVLMRLELCIMSRFVPTD